MKTSVAGAEEHSTGSMHKQLINDYVNVELGEDTLRSTKIARGAVAS